MTPAWRVKKATGTEFYQLTQRGENNLNKYFNRETDLSKDRKLQNKTISY